MKERIFFSTMDVFKELALTVRGQEAIKLVQDVTEHPDIYTFSEFLASPGIKEVNIGQNPTIYFDCSC